ncbi:MAG: hypothetical protein J5I93_08620, partial [Pirellulaceae bacterium]|nr:hypothetical protein [Pirellulaceae bacterium]
GPRQHARSVVGWNRVGDGHQASVARLRFYQPPLANSMPPMARWPKRTWTTIFTYGTIFVLFPLLCLLAWAYVYGWLF